VIRFVTLFGMVIVVLQRWDFVMSHAQPVYDISNNSVSVNDIDLFANIVSQ